MFVMYSVSDYYRSKLFQPDQFLVEVTKRKGDLDLISNGLFYRGSDSNFHYFIEWRIPGASDFYMVRRELLPIPIEFQVTKDRKKWARCSGWFHRPNDASSSKP